MIMIAQGYLEQEDVLVVKPVWQTENRCSCGHADQVMLTLTWPSGVMFKHWPSGAVTGSSGAMFKQSKFIGHQR